MMKTFYKILPVVLCLLCILGNVYANDDLYNSECKKLIYDDPDDDEKDVYVYVPCKPNEGNGQIDNLISSVDKVWASVLLIVQVVSVACVVFAGVRYMYASADKKADIKKGLTYLVIGATLVFATSTIIRFVMSVGNEIIN